MQSDDVIIEVKKSITDRFKLLPKMFTPILCESHNIDPQKWNAGSFILRCRNIDKDMSTIFASLNRLSTSGTIHVFLYAHIKCCSTHMSGTYSTNFADRYMFENDHNHTRQHECSVQA